MSRTKGVFIAIILLWSADVWAYRGTLTHDHDGRGSHIHSYSDSSDDAGRDRGRVWMRTQGNLDTHTAGHSYSTTSLGLPNYHHDRNGDLSSEQTQATVSRACEIPHADSGSPHSHQENHEHGNYPPHAHYYSHTHSYVGKKGYLGENGDCTEHLKTINSPTNHVHTGSVEFADGDSYIHSQSPNVSQVHRDSRINLEGVLGVHNHSGQTHAHEIGKGVSFKIAPDFKNLPPSVLHAASPNSSQEHKVAFDPQTGYTGEGLPEYDPSTGVIDVGGNVDGGGNVGGNVGGSSNTGGPSASSVATKGTPPQTETESAPRCTGELSVTIELQQGRNYLHLPFDVCDIETLGDIYSLLEPSHLLYYDGDERVRATVDTDYILAPYQGFQVWMTEAQTLELSGIPYPDDIEIQIVEGWQYVGFPRMSTAIDTTYDLRNAGRFSWIATHLLDGSDRMMVSVNNPESDVAIIAGMCFYVHSFTAFTIELDGSDWGMSVAQAPSVRRKGTLATSWGAMKQ